RHRRRGSSTSRVRRCRTSTASYASRRAMPVPHPSTTAGRWLALVSGLQSHRRTQMEGSSKRNTMVTGMFRDRDSAERAYQSATGRGYGTQDINLAMSEDTRKKYFADGSTTE